MTELSPLYLLAAFQVKHFLGDYVFQTAYILNHRRIWGHPGGLLHVLVHAVLTLPILLVAGVHVLLHDFPDGCVIGRSVLRDGRQKKNSSRKHRQNMAHLLGSGLRR